MGRRKNNPNLVQELISGLWSMDQDEFETKYASLSSGDMSKVSDAIDKMQTDWLDDDGLIPEGCAACGGDYPNCTSSCSLFDD